MRFLLLFLSFVSLAAAQAVKPIPVIFDTDIGDDIDDALALALALQSPELDVRLVTTVVDDVESRTRLAWKELRLYNRKDIALATGASMPLLDPIHTGRAQQFEVLTAADDIPPGANRRAVDVIISTLLASHEKITLIPVGPLMNIALALRVEPRIKDKIERIVLMGGAFTTSRPEYNIDRDRAAAQIVFTSGVPITAVGLDVTTKCKLQGSDMEKLRAADNPASKFLVRLIELWQNGKSDQYPTLHDPLAVAAVIKKGFIDTEAGSVSVEQGVTKFAADASGTTLAAREVDVRGFLNLLVTRLAAPPRVMTMR